MRLIDADALIFELEEWKKNPNNDDSAVDLVNHFIGIIKALPSAEPKTGKWIDCNWSIRCSECGYSMPWAVRNFCPNCGARMKGGDTE